MHILLFFTSPLYVVHFTEICKICAQGCEVAMKVETGTPGHLGKDGLNGPNGQYVPCAKRAQLDQKA